MNEISDVDVYFKRLYSKTTNPPPISVDEFLDILKKCKESPIQRERVSVELNIPIVHYLFQSSFKGSISKWY